MKSRCSIKTITKYLFLFFCLYTIPSFSVVLDRDEMILTDPDQRTTIQAVARIQAALGFQLTVPVIIQNSRRDVSPRIRETIAALPANHYAMTIPAFVHDAGYWLRDENGVLTKAFKHICWDGCMFPNAVMTNQQTWNDILATMIKVRNENGWYE